MAPDARSPGPAAASHPPPLHLSTPPADAVGTLRTAGALWAASLFCAAMSMPLVGLPDVLGVPHREQRAAAAVAVLALVGGAALRRVARDGAAVRCADGHAVIERTGPRYRRAEGPTARLEILPPTWRYPLHLDVCLSGLTVRIGPLSDEEKAALRAHVDAARAAPDGEGPRAG